jgi:glycopeptide antibiotics resistance protein
MKISCSSRRLHNPIALFPMHKDRQISQILAVLAVISLAGVVYASAVPLRYEPASLTEVWRRFLQTPWYWLPLNKRADWVANGLVMIPFGFFFAGALQWNRSSFRRQQVVLVVFALLQIGIVSAIEAMQVWFPPRVRSLNDMLSGYVGGIVGVLIWNFVGKRIVESILTFPDLPKGFPRIALLAKISVICLILHGLMPFDVMLSPADWSAKFDNARFNWVPFVDLQGIADAVKKILLSVWAFAFGLVLAKQHPKADAMRQIILWCLAVELVSVPIYGRETSSTIIVFSSTWGILGVIFQDQVFHILRQLDRAVIWLAGVIGWSAIVYAGFLYRFKHVVTEPEILAQRLSGFWAIPFARAQRSTEFQALENILLKLIAFAALGFLLNGWVTKLNQVNRTFSTGLIITWIILLGAAIEFSQAFLIPLIADITDIILYTTGGALGCVAYQALLSPAPKQIRQ